MFSTNGRENNETQNENDDVDLPGELGFAGSARFAFAKMSINTRWTDSGDIDIYFYIFYFQHPKPSVTFLFGFISHVTGALTKLYANWSHNLK